MRSVALAYAFMGSVKAVLGFVVHSFESTNQLGEMTKDLNSVAKENKNQHQYSGQAAKNYLDGDVVFDSDDQQKILEELYQSRESIS
jgi:hypothetical protein